MSFLQQAKITSLHSDASVSRLRTLLSLYMGAKHRPGLLATGAKRGPGPVPSLEQMRVVFLDSLNRRQ